MFKQCISGLLSLIFFISLSLSLSLYMFSLALSLSLSLSLSLHLIISLALTLSLCLSVCLSLSLSLSLSTCFHLFCSIPSLWFLPACVYCLLAASLTSPHNATQKHSLHPGRPTSTGSHGSGKQSVRHKELRTLLVNSESGFLRRPIGCTHQNRPKD